MAGRGIDLASEADRDKSAQEQGWEQTELSHTGCCAWQAASGGDGVVYRGREAQPCFRHEAQWRPTITWSHAQLLLLRKAPAARIMDSIMVPDKEENRSGTYKVVVQG